jgi:hypothetical protein
MIVFIPVREKIWRYPVVDSLLFQCECCGSKVFGSIISFHLYSFRNGICMLLCDDCNTLKVRLEAGI